MTYCPIGWGLWSIGCWLEVYLPIWIVLFGLGFVLLYRYAGGPAAGIALAGGLAALAYLIVRSLVIGTGIFISGWLLAAIIGLGFLWLVFTRV